MKTREIGTLEVSEMGAGCMSISANYGPPADINQGFAVIRFARLTHCNSVAPCLAMALATACKCNPPSGKPPQRALQRVCAEAAAVCAEFEAVVADCSALAELSSTLCNSAFSSPRSKSS